MSRTAKPSAPAASKSQPAPQGWKERLAPEDYEELKNAFDAFDQDGSGTIDPSQINKAIQELGVQGRNAIVLSLIYGLRDQNKQLNFNQFLDAVCSRIGQCKTKDGIKRVFALYDTDENGLIEHDQVYGMAKLLKQDFGEEDIQELMHSTAINHKFASNQSFSFEDFYNVVSKYNGK